MGLGQRLPRPAHAEAYLRLQLRCRARARRPRDICNRGPSKLHRQTADSHKIERRSAIATRSRRSKCSALCGRLSFAYTARRHPWKQSFINGAALLGRNVSSCGTMPVERICTHLAPSHEMDRLAGPNGRPAHIELAILALRLHSERRPQNFSQAPPYFETCWH